MSTKKQHTLEYSLLNPESVSEDQQHDQIEKLEVLIRETDSPVTKRFGQAWVDKLKHNSKYPIEAYGRKIRSVDEVCDLAHETRSVICPDMWGVLPCAVVQNMQARMVKQCVDRGLYLYTPITEREEIKQKKLDL
jgi:hypothetical protein